MSGAIQKAAARVERPKLLIVEGQDELLLFNALLKWLGLADVQVLAVGGKTRITDNLAALVLDPSFASVSALAVVRDADFPEGIDQGRHASGPGSAARAAFRSVCDALTQNGLPAPPRHGVFASGPPRTAIFVLPDGEADGMLEDLCLTAVSSDPAHACMDQYFSCLASAGIAHAPNRVSKARIHAFLASRPEPDPRLGMAATKGYLDFSTGAFGPLVGLLREL